MRICLPAILLVGCAAATPRPAGDSVVVLEDAWNDARLHGDAVRVADLLSDDWALTHVDGRVERKDSYVRDIAAHDRQIQSIEIRDRQIRVYDDVAVVTGEAVQRGLRRGELRSGRLRFIHVWVRRDGTWRMVASQSTEMKE